LVLGTLEGQMAAVIQGHLDAAVYMLVQAADVVKRDAVKPAVAHADLDDRGVAHRLCLLFRAE
jgi:hypothetical protein